ncbi:hypothetical protein [Couchioplanes azureus]|uniref:hypothetical protein n=1 Tax=Couchioplanes caeruleus TaxID=56438 RepID=UPI00166F7FF3|nr:hypothetical protein [Couchioplanes caeruleus]GGQ67076.1 hypothetical protein GCM10010166_41130 [Couchioplanes caeruleus subsp. azureus]
MSARTMARHRRTATEHTAWCARDHRCNLNEHRSPELIADLPGAGRAIVTRVRDANGREYVEIRARIPLHHTETGARWQVATTVRLLREVLAAVAIRHGVLRGRTANPPARRPELHGADGKSFGGRAA